MRSPAISFRLEPRALHLAVGQKTLPSWNEVSWLRLARWDLSSGKKPGRSCKQAWRYRPPSRVRTVTVDQRNPISPSGLKVGVVRVVSHNFFHFFIIVRQIPARPSTARSVGGIPVAGLNVKQ